MVKYINNSKALFFILIISLSLFSFTVVASAESNALDRVVILETKDGFNKEEAARMKERIGRIHPVIIHALSDKGLIIKLINFPLTDLAEYQFLRGEIPRGWEGTGKTWDDVPGAGGSPAVARIGYSEASEWHGTINLELHELAHLIDSHVFDYSSHTAEFTTIHKEEQLSFLPSSYFNNAEEYFAEAFSYFYLGGERNAILKQQAPKTYEYIKKLPAILSGEVPDVEDTDVPVITLQGGNSIELNIGDAYEELGATATDNIDGDLSDAIEITGEVNTEKSGQYLITYSVTDKAGNNTTATRTIQVLESDEDTTAPVITLLGDASIELHIGDFYEELGATAADNIEGNITEAIEVSGKVNTAKSGKYIITYSVADISGNTASTSREVNVIDKVLTDDITPPVITINGDNPTELSTSDIYDELGATAEDAVDGDVSKAIEITGDINTDKPGQFMITYSVTDNAGNIVAESRTVNVIDSTDLEKDSDVKEKENEETVDGTQKDDKIVLPNKPKDDGRKGFKDNAKSGDKKFTSDSPNTNGPALPLSSSSTNIWLLILIGLLFTVSGSSMLLVRKTT